MTRTTYALLPLLAVLALPPSPAAAGPPDGPSGKLMYDQVADGLRKYREEKDEAKRAEWLRRLAPTRDPRVAVELWEVFAWVRGKRTAPIRQVARDCLADYFVAGAGGSPEAKQSDEERGSAVCSWWSRSGADLRRRAAQLPR
jgi:hypothetical protein